MGYLNRRSTENDPSHTPLSSMYEYNSSKDDELLMNLGYNPELKRNFSPLQVFGIAFSIMSLVPSIASVFVDSISAGGAGMTWGWLVPSLFIMSVGVSLSEFGSSMPTSGGLYWWSFKFAPKKLAKPACWLSGYANTLGLVGGIVSIDSGFAGMILSVPAMASDGNFVPTKYMNYGVFAACVIAQLAIASTSNRFLSRLQTVCIVLNMILIFLICIALPVGIKSHGKDLNSASFVFGDTTNQYGWSYGWAFLLSWMAPIWTIGAFDSCIHMSEEASNAATAVPLGICMSIGMCAVLGWVIQAILAACLLDVEGVVNTSTGQPMAQLIMDSLDKRWAIAIMCVMFVVQFLMGLSILVAASRQTWAFSRDGALPFSGWVRKINLKHGVPINALIFDTILSLAIGCLTLIDPTAALAVFSLAVSSNGLAWMMPILMRVINFDAASFVPGPFYLGHRISRINNVISCVYLTFVVFVLSQMPTTKNPTAQEMNYTCIINPTIWIGAMLYYFISAHKWFTGPKLTIGTVEGVDPVVSEKLAGSKVTMDKSGVRNEKEPIVEEESGSSLESEI
ncbi:GABA-specific permease [Wickerhamiella sorbophila]|uniref:GABA-specific permease n=1 Tax=Wickerhamiella sorbophila TaxID=45607 RepID=A0A2T0FI10_9ASCO|nr:GABA-specific permease [Wickerhamiella sorbophila]PRT54606.1 GABA-specific permease [Wickerhamiella sorbophila]